MLTRLMSRLLGSRWGRGLGGALAAVVLFPLPGLALTFLTPWTLVAQVRKGTASPANGVLFSDLVTPKGVRSAVQVDMGSAPRTPPGRAASTVVIERQFQVDPAHPERLQFEPLMDGQYRNLKYSISAVIGQEVGGKFKVHDRFVFRGQTPPFTTSGTAHRALTSRLLRNDGEPYTIRVTVRYSKKGHGFWSDHVHLVGSASFHRFAHQPG